MLLFRDDDDYTPNENELVMEDETDDKNATLKGAPQKDYESCSPNTKNAKIDPLLRVCREFAERLKLTMSKLVGNVMKRHINTDETSEKDPLQYKLFDKISKGENPLENTIIDPKTSLSIAEECGIGQKKWDKLRGRLQPSTTLASRYSLDKLRHQMYPDLEKLDTGYWYNLGTAVTSTIQGIVDTEGLELKSDEQYIGDCCAGLDGCGWVF